MDPATPVLRLIQHTSPPSTPVITVNLHILLEHIRYHWHVRSPQGRNTHIAKIARPILGLLLASNPLPSEIDPNFKVFFPEYLTRPRLVDTDRLAVLENDKWG